MMEMLKVTVACVIVILALGCEPATEPESAVFRDFNLGALVQQSGAPQLRTGTGGSTYTSTPIESKHRRTFDLEYQLDERGSPFDQAGFLNNLEEKIAEAVSVSGARIEATQPRDGGTLLTYAAGNRRGSVEFKGERLEGNRYKVSGEICERVVAADNLAKRNEIVTE